MSLVVTQLKHRLERLFMNSDQSPPINHHWLKSMASMISKNRNKAFVVKNQKDTVLCIDLNFKKAELQHPNHVADLVYEELSKRFTDSLNKRVFNVVVNSRLKISSFNELVGDKAAEKFKYFNF